VDFKKAYPNTEYVAAHKGWMEEVIFYNWFLLTFVPFDNTLREKFQYPVQAAVLSFDGHKSHFSLHIILCAIKNDILLLKFPSHLTDLLQPLDKSAFLFLKGKWDAILVDYGRKHIGLSLLRISKETFAELLGRVWTEALTPKNIAKGFTSIGLLPVDRSKFPQSSVRS